MNFSVGAPNGETRFQRTVKGRQSCAVGQGSVVLPPPASSPEKYLLDFLFPIKQRSIAVPMDLADSLSFVELEELLAVALHIQHWFL